MESQCANWLVAIKALEIKLCNIYCMSLARCNLAGSDNILYWNLIYQQAKQLEKSLMLKMKSTGHNLSLVATYESLHFF